MCPPLNVRFQKSGINYNTSVGKKNINLIGNQHNIIVNGIIHFQSQREFFSVTKAVSRKTCTAADDLFDVWLFLVLHNRERLDFLKMSSVIGESLEHRTIKM